MALSVQDAQAIAAAARRLGVDPGTLGGLMELESGVDPNIWGGAGGRYRGLIQFGPEARKEVGLPDKPMSISEQVPYVEKYFQQRGFTPGKHGATELYRTVLVGNPHQSGTDSFGTNSDRAAQKMLPGGEYYERFKKKFDPVFQSGGAPAATPLASSSPQAGPSRRAAAAGAGGGWLAGIFKDAMAELEAPSGGPGLDVSGLLRAATLRFGGGRKGPSTRKASGPEFLKPMAETGQAWKGVEDDGIPDMAALAGSLIAKMMGGNDSSPALPGSSTGQAPLGSSASTSWQRLKGWRTGNSGGSTGPHLDVRWADKSKISPGDVSQYFRVGGKPLDAYPVTSPYGMRTHPIHGDRRLHAGFDLGTPEDLDIDMAPGVKALGSFYDEGGGGKVQEFEVPTPKGPKRLRFLHGN